MCKEAYEFGLGKRYPVSAEKWQGRPGKTKRDKEVTGAWYSRLTNRAERAEENRSGKRKR